MRRVLTATHLASLTRDTRPWLSCEECFERLDAYAERRAADPAHADPVMDTHLAGCSACAEEAMTVLLLAADDDGMDPADAVRRLAAG
jgi:hypothetical protein